MRFRALLVLVVCLLASCQEKQDELHRSWRIMKVTVRQPKGQIAVAQGETSVQNRADSVFSDAHLHLYPNQQYGLLYKNGKYVTQRWDYDYKTERVTLIGNTPSEELQLRKTDAGPDWIEFEWTGKRKNAFGLPEVTIGLLCSQNAKYEYEDTDLLHPDRNRWREKPTAVQSDEQIRKRLVEQLAYIIDYFQLAEDKKHGYFETAFLQSSFRFYNRGLGLAPADDLPEKWVKTFYDEAEAQKALRMLAEALKNSGDYPTGKTFTEEYREVMKKMKLYLEK